MVYYKITTDKSGKSVKNYYMTQGDTFQNQISITDKNGEEVYPNLIVEVRFKLSNLDYKEEFRELYEYNDTMHKWTIQIDSEDTTKWEVGTHIYEYEILYSGGVVSTPVQAKFTVQNQIQGG